MLNYEKKYFKYKMKYLELKKQIGGIIGECTFFSKSEDNANLLLKRYKEEKCNNDDIRRFGPKAFIQAGLIKLTFNTGNPQPLLELFNIKDLKDAGFNPGVLYYHNSKHFTPEKLLHEGEYSIQELIKAGLTPKTN